MFVCYCIKFFIFCISLQAPIMKPLSIHKTSSFIDSPLTHSSVTLQLCYCYTFIVSNQFKAAVRISVYFCIWTFTSEFMSFNIFICMLLVLSHSPALFAWQHLMPVYSRHLCIFNAHQTIRFVSKTLWLQKLHRPIRLNQSFWIICHTCHVNTRTHPPISHMICSLTGPSQPSPNWLASLCLSWAFLAMIMAISVNNTLPAA